MVTLRMFAIDLFDTSCRLIGLGLQVSAWSVYQLRRKQHQSLGLWGSESTRKVQATDGASVNGSKRMCKVRKELRPKESSFFAI